MRGLRPEQVKGYLQFADRQHTGKSFADLAIRFHRDDELFGESRLAILPTLARTIPFERTEEWNQIAAQFQESAVEIGTDNAEVPGEPGNQT
jgi:hypothetical protein